MRKMLPSVGAVAGVLIWTLAIGPFISTDPEWLYVLGVFSFIAIGTALGLLAMRLSPI